MEADDGNTQKQHLLHLLSGIIAWIDPPDVVSTAIVNGKSERLILVPMPAYSLLMCYA